MFRRVVSFSLVLILISSLALPAFATGEEEVVVEENVIEDNFEDLPVDQTDNLEGDFSSSEGDEVDSSNDDSEGVQDGVQDDSEIVEDTNSESSDITFEDVSEPSETPKVDLTDESIEMLTESVTESVTESMSPDSEEMQTVNISDESIAAIAEAVSASSDSLTVFNKNGQSFIVPESMAEIWDDYDYHLFSWRGSSTGYRIWIFFNEGNVSRSNGYFYVYGSGVFAHAYDFDSSSFTPEYISKDAGYALTIKTIYYSDVDILYDDGALLYQNDIGYSPTFVVNFDTGFDDLIFDPQYSDNFILPQPSYEGYEFLGWYLDSDYMLPFPESGEYEFKEDTTLYAKWKKYVVISFETGFDDIVFENQYSQDFSLPVVPEREGMIFAGWYLDSEFTEEYTSGFEFVEDTTLYAKWIEEPPLVVFHRSIFDSIGMLLQAEPILYIVSIMGVGIIIIIGKKIFASRF